MPSDKERARWFIKNEWRTGRIPHPKTLICSFCPKAAIEYHHYQGHEEEHWRDVIPVCRACHFKHDKAKQMFLEYIPLNPFKEKYELLKGFAAAYPTLFEEYKLTKRGTHT